MSEPRDPSPYSKDRPFPARIVENRLLTAPGSDKETRHLVVSLAGSGLAYKPGDSLGAFPSNRPSEVAEILALLGATGEEPVALPREAGEVPLAEALSTRLSLAGPTRRFLETLAGRAVDPGEKSRLDALLDPAAKDALDAFLAERQFVDLLGEFPGARPGPQLLVDHLRRLVPRLYSIASSPRAHPGEAHQTVAGGRYRTNGRDRVGVASGYLAERVRVGVDTVPVFTTHAPFGLPEDGGRDIVMVGPGTGVAPFRAFVEERAAVGAKGRNWLFFGDRRRATDFLYEAEWTAHLAAGRLARLDTAFSRDQATKIYVQDRMRENAAELWSWISGGAAFYVCGDARRMAKDVDAALHQIVAERGGMAPAEAAEYVKRMRKEKRYQRDVY